MTMTRTLSDNSRVRFATGSMMYFAQGIPQGLLSIAIPAWLASLGASASDIGSYLAVIVLPWAFKLISGPFMDRFQFPPMGRRRPWVIVAQLGLTLSLLSLMLIDNPVEQLGLLMILGVIINSFAATQDVAVDGMSIDLTPINEQGRLNAFMSFGKAMGWAATSAVSGVLLVSYGMKVTAIAASVTAGLIFLAFLFILERKGERILPWSKGQSGSPRKHKKSFGDVFKGINKTLWTRASIIILVIMVFDGLIVGYGQALMPVAAINVFGYTTPQWSQLVAMMGLIGALLALALGPLVDRFGSKRMLLATASLLCVHAFLLAQTQYMWEDTTYVRVMLSIWVMMLPVTMVCVIALGMSVCGTRNSATQFAIYMSASNLGHSAGSKLFGMVSDQATYDVTYMVLGSLVIGLILVLVFHRHQSQAEGETESRNAAKFAVGSAGSGGGVFFSNAMQCPKCRFDMEQIDYQGTEVDRCTLCDGLWFDAGEMEILRNKEAALALDVGDAGSGKQLNQIDDYRCPRCGGEMSRQVDEQQRHIWFETCNDCHGSFFDAGEFRDLSEHSISDFFKRLVTPKRH